LILRLKILQIVTFFFLFFLLSCGDTSYYPRPVGYIRIDLPEHSYQVFDTSFPYSFQYSKFAVIQHDEITYQEPFWINLAYPQFKGKVHLSYKSLDSFDLHTLQEDSRRLVFQHAEKAVGITESEVYLPKSGGFGMVYFIEGKEAASPFQFWITDSVHHFMRGALYFNHLPNNDSLKPVIDFIVKDMDYLFETFNWK